uniref:65-kDa microtubule-associated protein 6-like n=1 Tax=Erigeron canadensis TaxID=72917 RepID=UPI001CB8EA2A|nr:65-kDa microtubule-associated protein 6-like [Erigeron canadensis]
MLIELEIECLQVYRRKLDEAANAKARLHQSVAAKEAELATLVASLGDFNVYSLINVDKKASSLKGQLMILTPLVEDLELKKEERIKQFADITSQNANAISSVNIEEPDLSTRKLGEYQSCLRSTQKEKSERVHKVLAYVNEVHSFCSILGSDFGKTVNAVHPSLHDISMELATNISDSTSEGLENAILKLETEKKVRLLKLKDIVMSLFELWNIMDTTREEKSYFSRITSTIRFPESEIVDPGALSTEIIQQVSEEVERLNKLKGSKMKEPVMKRWAELEEICFKTHIKPDPSTAVDKSNAMMDSCLVDPGELLANIEVEISKVSSEAFSRKEILDRIDRWLSACEEESWLEEYSVDPKRYSGGRSVHISLKRAERARITVKSIPAIVDNLICKTLTWEDYKKKFLYDGARLVTILGEYKLSRLQKEEEKKRSREQKKLRELLLKEKESIYGSKSNPRRAGSFRKSTNGTLTPTPPRSSIGNATPDLMTPRSYSGRHNGYFKDLRKLSTGPLCWNSSNNNHRMILWNL